MTRIFMRSVFVMLLTMVTSNIYAQYSATNSYFRRAIVMYVKGADGFYKRVTDRMLDNVDGVISTYVYDKKAKILYVLTENANCAVTLNKDYAKKIKKDVSIKQLKDDELTEEIEKSTKYLDDKYNYLNEERTRHIQDSIAKEKARADSIRHIRALERAAAARKAAEDNYRKTHDFVWVPTGGTSLYCSLCENYFYEDSVLCLGIKNDSIYFSTTEYGDLGLAITKCHAAKIPEDLAKDNKFLYHYRVFKDSLTNDTIDYQGVVDLFNWVKTSEYLDKIKRIAPYGYFESWGWDNEYSTVSFNFRYMNTNPKTIRYITVYFKITNDVGDVRKTGYFKGTGPLAQWESASWDWDHSSYFVAGDATKMSITKVVLTWMNGKQQVVSGRYLRFNNKN